MWVRPIEKVGKMLAKRIIPCLDIKNGKVVKGVNFRNVKKIGNAVELARDYYEQGADEISFLDINASYENRKIIIELVRKVAKQVFVPLSVGGGINSIEVIEELLQAGAEKISIGTAAALKPELVRESALRFGSQAIVVSIDAKKKSDGWNVYIKGGREDTGEDVIEFSRKMEKLGAGEILLNSIDKDGVKGGFDVALCREVGGALNIPIIASGGAGKLEDFKDILSVEAVDAALAASIFHNKEYSIGEVKKYLDQSGVEVRL
jgi:imidazole glycerol-phosphate synthase subunit HisF